MRVEVKRKTGEKKEKKKRATSENRTGGSFADPKFAEVCMRWAQKGNLHSPLFSVQYGVVYVLYLHNVQYWSSWSFWSTLSLRRTLDDMLDDMMLVNNIQFSHSQVYCGGYDSPSHFHSSITGCSGDRHSQPLLALRKVKRQTQSPLSYPTSCCHDPSRPIRLDDWISRSLCTVCTGGYPCGAKSLPEIRFPRTVHLYCTPLLPLDINHIHFLPKCLSISTHDRVLGCRARGS